MIIGVVSGKGGVGKTTIASNLSYYLASVGKKVTLIDCNLTTSHLNFNFGFFKPEATLNDVLSGNKSIEEVSIKYKNLNIIPASLSLNDLMYIDTLYLKEVVRKIDSDFVFLDSAPGLGREAVSVLKSVDTAILVATPFLNSIADVIRTNKVLNELDVFPLGIVLNMVKRKSYELKKWEVEAITKIKVIETVPYDENVEASLSMGKPFIEMFPNSPASISIKRIAESLFGIPYEERKIGFIENIFEKIRTFGNKFRII